MTVWRIIRLSWELLLGFSIIFSYLLNPVLGGKRGEKPRITETPQSVSTIVGQTALFVCLVEGNPAPKIHWKISGVPVSESHFGQTVKIPRGSVLRVPNILPSYNGAVITCSATNALGRAEHSAKLTVYSDETAVPPGFPQFLNSFSVIVAKKNGAVELECRTSGDPQPTVAWYRNNIPVDVRSNRFKQMETGNLHISGLVEDDEGKYECLASNDKGSRLSSGDDLLVRDNIETSLHLIASSTRRFRPHFTNVPPSRQIVPPGGRLALTCTAVGAPVPSVNWYRGTRRLHQLDQQQPGTASIQLLDLSESVNVSCVAESSMGRVYHDVTVVVKNLPEPPGQPKIIDIGSTYAHLAFEPSPPSEQASAIANYLLFWIASKQMDTHSVDLMPLRAIGSTHNPSFVGFEPAVSPEVVHPNFNLIRAELKNVTQNADGRVSVLDPSLTAPLAGNRLFAAVVTSITQLKPYTDYTVWARAVGVDGDASRPGPRMNFVTQEIAPSSPPRNVNAQAISNAAVTISWDPPLEANGKIMAYRVYHTDRPDQELAFWDKNIVDAEAASQDRGDLPQKQASHTGQLFILSHLTANATYLIRVSAVNAKGEGPPSDVSVVIVRPGLLPKPKDFTAVTKSSHQIQLSWMPPSDVEPSSNTLQQYILSYAPAATTTNTNWLMSIEQASSGLVQTQLFNSTTTGTLLSALRPDTKYVFGLAALSPTGPGVSAFVFARTKKYVPSEPTNLFVRATSHTELEVRWQAPVPIPAANLEEEKSTRIVYYDLSWRPSTETGGWRNKPSGMQTSWTGQHVGPDRHGPSRRLVPANDETNTYTTKITDLQPDTYYVVQVRAVASSGSGERAIGDPVKTMNPPASAPGNLRLFSQILAPAGPQLPPQVLIKVSWEKPTDTELPRYTTYRVRWKLLLSKSSALRRMRRSAVSADRWLYWVDLDPRTDEESHRVIPEKYLNGEVNTTETMWNPQAGLFFLGMTYEFRVAVIKPEQVGHEAVQLIALEGSAPTGSPTDLRTTTGQDKVILSWAPPGWAHRHGPFVAYEVRCGAINPVGNHVRQLNLTMESSTIEWPKVGHLGVQSLIAWPMGRVDLEAQEFGDDLLRRDVKCRVRAYTKYGVSPWSLKVDIYAQAQSAVPPPPKKIHAIILPDNQLLISWAMPPALVQTLIPVDDLSPILPLSILYRRFAVYTSPIEKKNWTRRLTNGPVSEFIVSHPEGHPHVQVRVSSIGTGGHEGTWSEPVRAYRVQPDLGLRVTNLTCSPVYENEHASWMLQLTWENPQWLSMKGNQERLLHYRVHYSSTSTSREVSAQVASPTVLDRIEHQLRGLQSDRVYTVSVRPVIWFDLAMLSTNQLVDRYGLEASVVCAIPRKPPIQIEPPWVVKETVTPNEQSDSLVVGCAVYNLSKHTAHFSLLAYKLDQPFRTEKTNLASWIQDPPFLGEKQFFRVHLTELSVEKAQRNAKKVAGQRLIPKTTYALALRVCIEEMKTVCLQSLWTRPVGTHLEPPPVRQVDPPGTSDPDHILWNDEDIKSSVMSQPPSDDATARGPSWPIEDNSKVLPSYPTHTFVNPSRYPVEQKTRKRSGTMPLLITAICITLFFIGLAIVCSLYIIYRRRVNKSWTEQDGRQPTGRPKYSLLNWNKCTSTPTKLSPGKRSNPNSINLSHLQGPPSGISSITANLPPVLTYHDDSLMAMDARMNGTLLSTNGSLDMFGSTSQFDNVPLANGTPNGTLMFKQGGLQRTDSLTYRVATSPSPTGAQPFRPFVGNDLISGYNGFSVGSLKSVNTQASRSEGLGLSCVNPMTAHLSNSRCTRPIEVSKLIEHVENLKADNGRLMSAEFESIDPGGQFTWEHSNRPSNRSKNRYANVIAYDHSRVVLKPTSITDPDSDYINANYLDGYKKLNAYIATQGPLPNTINDFWRMVWEQKSAIIVSMTRLEERARVKCEQYWPGAGMNGGATPSPSRFGNSLYHPDTKSLVILDANNNALTQPVAPFRQTTGFCNDADLSTVFTNSLSHHSFPEETIWPSNGSELISEAIYGELTVGLVEIVELAYYTVRTLVLQKSGSPERREVHQLQFTAWPDHGVPNHPAPLLMFLRRVRAENHRDAGPMIVHCSAGVGRTGAFILLDILLEQMRQERVVDVFGSVSRLRAQRNFMVQTEDQYAFVYEALVEASASGNTELTVRQLPTHWNRLISSGSIEDVRTGLDVEFSQLGAQNRLTKLVTSAPNCVGLLSPIDPLSTHDEVRNNLGVNAPQLPSLGGKGCAGTARVNLSKNRDPDILPHEANRVALRALRGSEGSDYINASYIDGYRSRAAYIATQAPLTCTMDDFWRMIWETGSCLIVRLEKKLEQTMSDLPNYWPTEQSSRHGFLIVDPVSSYPMTSYVMYELRLTDTRDGATRTVRLFDAAHMVERMKEFTAYWDPQGGSTYPIGPDFKQTYQQLSEVMLDLIVQVHKTKEHFGIDGPITVHCNTGGGRTGVFLAISIVLQRMRYEGVVDMFQTVKLLRWQRPALVRTPAEYAFCYVTALEYLESFERYTT